MNLKRQTLMGQLRRLLLAVMLIAVPTLFSLAQPRPQEQGDGNTVGGNPISGGTNGGSAPIGEGIALLVALGGLYAGGKLIYKRKAE